MMPHPSEGDKFRGACLRSQMETGLRRALRHLPHGPQQGLLPVLAGESVLSQPTCLPSTAQRPALRSALGFNVRRKLRVSPRHHAHRHSRPHE